MEPGGPKWWKERLEWPLEVFLVAQPWQPWLSAKEAVHWLRGTGGPQGHAFHIPHCRPLPCGSKSAYPFHSLPSQEQRQKREDYRLPGLNIGAWFKHIFKA